MSASSLSGYARAASRAARHAGRLLAQHVGRPSSVATKRGINDLVTDIDRASERMIHRVLHRAYPDFGFLGEEHGRRRTASPYQWIVDPLDGTTNFAHGYPAFCVSIGLEIDGRVVLGVVYDPLRRELFEAEAGKGAFLNAERIHVSTVASLNKALLVTGFAYDRESRQRNLVNFSRFILETHGIRRSGSAALDLSYVAAGRVDGFWELKLSPWDVAAGSLIVIEAGGRVTDFAGRAFKSDGAQTLATNGLIHQEMVDVLTGR